MKIVKGVLPWAILLVVLIAGFIVGSALLKKSDERLETYKRQLGGQLTEKEQELQKSHHEIGLLKAKLTDKIDKLEETSTAFEQFKKEHNLVIRAKDKSIAQLKQQINNGTAVATANPGCNLDGCIITYKWQDTYGRFNLYDPNIFEDGASFESNQYFKVYGELYDQKDSSLQVRRLVLKEVHKNGDTYEEIPNAEAKIIDSEFVYTNEPVLQDEWKWTDLFRLRGVAMATVGMFPDLGAIKFAGGLSFFDWEGININSTTAIDFTNLENWEQRVGISYSPRFWNLDLNMAAGISLGTPFVHFGQQFSFNIDLVFYLNN